MLNNRTPILRLLAAVSVATVLTLATLGGASAQTLSPAPVPNINTYPAQVIQNGGFEDSVLLQPNFWTTSGHADAGALYGPPKPHCGQQYLNMAVTTQGVKTIVPSTYFQYVPAQAYQDVFVPKTTDGATLSFWLSVQPGAYPSDDKLVASLWWFEGDVSVDKTLDSYTVQGGQVVNSHQAVIGPTSTWIKQSFDISTLAGQTLRVQFTVPAKSGVFQALFIPGPTLFDLDDVALWVQPHLQLSSC